MFKFLKDIKFIFFEFILCLINLNFLIVLIWIYIFVFFVYVIFYDLGIVFTFIEECYMPPKAIDAYDAYVYCYNFNKKIISTDLFLYQNNLQKLSMPEVAVRNYHCLVPQGDLIFWERFSSTGKLLNRNLFQLSVELNVKNYLQLDYLINNPRSTIFMTSNFLSHEVDCMVKIKGNLNYFQLKTKIVNKTLTFDWVDENVSKYIITPQHKLILDVSVLDLNNLNTTENLLLKHFKPLVANEQIILVRNRIGEDQLKFIYDSALQRDIMHLNFKSDSKLDL